MMLHQMANMCTKEQQMDAFKIVRACLNGAVIKSVCVPQPFLLLWIACDGVGGAKCQLKAVFLMSGGAVEGLAGSVCQGAFCATGTHGACSVVSRKLFSLTANNSILLAAGSGGCCLFLTSSMMLFVFHSRDARPLQV